MFGWVQGRTPYELVIIMAKEKNSPFFYNTFNTVQSPKINFSYEQEPFSGYLNPQTHDVFDTCRFTQKDSREDVKTATPKEKRSQSPGSCRKSVSSRPSSAGLINKCLYKLIGEPPKCHGNLSKRVESLEKKQDLWKERAHVWEKEKKTYQAAMENVSFYLDFKKPFRVLSRTFKKLDGFSEIQTKTIRNY